MKIKLNLIILVLILQCKINCVMEPFWGNISSLGITVMTCLSHYMFKSFRKMPTTEFLLKKEDYRVVLNLLEKYLTERDRSFILPKIKEEEKKDIEFKAINVGFDSILSICSYSFLQFNPWIIIPKIFLHLVMPNNSRGSDYSQLDLFVKRNHESTFFDRYLETILLTNNSNLIRNIDFLQKFYPYYIALEECKKRKCEIDILKSEFPIINFDDKKKEDLDYKIGFFANPEDDFFYYSDEELKKVIKNIIAEDRAAKKINEEYRKKFNNQELNSLNASFILLKKLYELIKNKNDYLEDTISLSMKKSSISLEKIDSEQKDLLLKKDAIDKVYNKAKEMYFFIEKYEKQIDDSLLKKKELKIILEKRPFQNLTNKSIVDLLNVLYPSTKKLVSIEEINEILVRVIKDFKKIDHILNTAKTLKNMISNLSKLHDFFIENSHFLEKEFKNVNLDLTKNKKYMWFCSLCKDFNFSDDINLENINLKSEKTNAIVVEMNKKYALPFSDSQEFLKVLTYYLDNYKKLVKKIEEAEDFTKSPYLKFNLKIFLKSQTIEKKSLTDLTYDSEYDIHTKTEQMKDYIIDIDDCLKAMSSYDSLYYLKKRAMMSDAQKINFKEISTIEDKKRNISSLVTELESKASQLKDF